MRILVLLLATAIMITSTVILVRNIGLGSKAEVVLFILAICGMLAAIMNNEAYKDQE